MERLPRAVMAVTAGGLTAISAYALFHSEDQKSGTVERVIACGTELGSAPSDGTPAEARTMAVKLNKACDDYITRDFSPIAVNISEAKTKQLIYEPKSESEFLADKLRPAILADYAIEAANVWNQVASTLAATALGGVFGTAVYRNKRLSSASSFSLSRRKRNQASVNKNQPRV